MWKIILQGHILSTAGDGTLSKWISAYRSLLSSWTRVKLRFWTEALPRHILGPINDLLALKNSVHSLILVIWVSNFDYFADTIGLEELSVSGSSGFASIQLFEFAIVGSDEGQISVLLFITTCAAVLLLLPNWLVLIRFLNLLLSLMPVQILDSTAHLNQCLSVNTGRDISCQWFQFNSGNPVNWRIFNNSPYCCWHYSWFCAWVFGCMKKLGKGDRHARYV